VTRRVLVTGGSRGIGAAIAKRLAGDGFRVTINYRQRKDAAEEVAIAIREAGGEADLLPFDISDREQVRETLASDLEANGAFYGVVCNAGVHADAAFPAMTDDAWDRVLRTNLDGFYNVLQPLIMPMVRARKGGRIVTMSSAAGLMGNRGQVNYSASKAGLVGAVRSLALEVAKRGVTVNAVAPTFIHTPGTAERLDDPEYLSAVVDRIPMGHVGTIADVAGAVIYLASDAAAMVNGTILPVDGGWTAQ